MAQDAHMSSDSEIEYKRYWTQNVQLMDGVAVTMNCSEDSNRFVKSDKSLSERIPILIANLWKQNNKVDIILLQECPPTCLDKALELLADQSNSAWDRRVEIESNTEIDSISTRKNAKANAIIFNTEKYEKLATRYDENMSDSFRISVDGQLERRHAHCRLIGKGTSNFQMDVLSFHGVHQDIGRRTIMDQETILSDYIKLLHGSSKKYKVPILIGGDWNIQINAGFVEKPSESTARLWKAPFVENGLIRHQRDILDYFIVFDYWGMYRNDKVIRLLNMLDTPVAKAHTDHKMASNLDHDPVFVPYQMLAYDRSFSGEDENFTFPRSLVSRYLNTETVRLQLDVNIVFPKRCMDPPMAEPVTWGRLLQERKDEIVLRYYYYKKGEYLDGSEIDPVKDKQRQQDSVKHRNQTVSTVRCREYIMERIQNMTDDRKRKTEITLTDLRTLNRKQSGKILHNHVFPNLLLYDHCLPLETECRILHAILQQKDRIWTKEEMESFIKNHLIVMDQKREDEYLNWYNELSRAQKMKFLYHVQLLLGYEIKDNSIQPKSIISQNLKMIGKSTLESLFKMFNFANPGQATRKELCRNIIAMKDDLSRKSSLVEASKTRHFIESLKGFLNKHLTNSADILCQYMEDSESGQVFMPIVAHTRWSIMGNQVDDSQYSTPQTSVLQVDSILGTTGYPSTDNTSSEAGKKPSALRPQDASQTCRSLQDELDRSAPSNPGKEDIHRIILQGLRAIHAEIRLMKVRGTGVMNKDNLQKLQKELKTKNKQLDAFLDEQIDGKSGEYREFQRKNPGAYSLTSYIMDHLVVKVGYDTGSKRKSKGFLSRFF